MGTRGSYPVSGKEYEEFGGGTSCYLLRRGDYAVVLDCGSGLSAAKRLLADCARIDIVLTHVHYDHIIGLLNWNVFPKTARLRLFATLELWFGEKTLQRFISPPFWPYVQQPPEQISVPPNGEAELDEGVRVRFRSSNHPDGASILRVSTDEGDVCVAFDYEHLTPFPLEMARECSLLIYDSMYTLEEYPTRKGWGHSCWQEGCALAHELGVRQLALTHHEPYRTDEALREMERQAKEVFPGARFARAGDVYEISGEGEDSL